MTKKTQKNIERLGETYMTYIILIIIIIIIIRRYK